MTEPHRKILIIGTGPAGYTAAIYASRANLQPLVLEGVQPGGQLTITTEVENFPGFRDGIQGPALMEELRAQALRLGAEIAAETVLSVELDQRPFRVVTESGAFTCEALVIATGASAKWLGIGKDEELGRRGGGVSACATCDGFFYRGKDVAVVGGGDTALEEALYLTRFARHVHLVHRREGLRASRAMQDRAKANRGITFHWNKAVADLFTRRVETSPGNAVEKLAGLDLRDTVDGSSSRLDVEGLFVAIGHRPNTAFLGGQLPLDANGYLLVEKGSSRTSIPGVFACGDVQDTIYRQAITAAGSGCMAAIDAERWLAETSTPSPSQETSHV
ncbi:thioredoxin-disulfide reductase [Mesoterricola silvestris]|uniref:Thioredoxin reductase n=1 Tax=Mesoterricola silvestris TaxID=2927979 RepID=A0AA48H1Y6_9BACT|nr:thioredoxin-disulfide reductase [Mesoterricola silvestris]BDU74518.1 thioredoxin reductase [Mesoterricola silvestris]